MTIAYLIGVAVCWMVLTVVSFAAKNDGEMDPVAAHGAAPLGLAMVWPLVGLFAVWLACRAIGVRLRKPEAAPDDSEPDIPEGIDYSRFTPFVEPSPRSTFADSLDLIDLEEERGMDIAQLQQTIGGEL